MKHILLSILLGILFIGCKKASVDQKGVSLSSSIVGTWELRQAQTGMIPTINYSSGNGNILKFTDSTYEKYTDGNPIIIGHYGIIRDTSVTAETGLVISYGQFINRIIFNGDFTSRKTFIEISNNKLTFLSGFFPTDGGSVTLYERKENNR